MPSFDPEDLSVWTGGRWSGTPTATLTGFSIDSRRISDGQAFVALKTERRDGHDFLAAARGAGASAAIVSRAVAGVDLAQLVVRDPLAALQAIAREHRRTFRGAVAGITGSAGKTSTKELLSALLGGESGGVLATEGNLNNHIGVALTLTRIDPARHAFAVVEAGISGPGEMGVLAGMIDPDLVIVTLVGAAHLADLGGLEDVAREKAALAGLLRKDGLCIFPKSCEGYAAFGKLPAASSLIVERWAETGIPDASEGRARFSLSQSADATELEVSYGPPPPVGLRLGRITDGMAQNAAMAVCAAIHLGVRREEIQGRIRTWTPSPLRGEWKVVDGRRLYLDCYNANPASMADALSAFLSMAPGNESRLFVIGSMEELGPDSARYHVELGRSLVLRACDRLVAVGSHAGSVRQGALDAGSQPGQIEVSDSIEALAAGLSSFRGSVFVKGSRRHGLERAFIGAELAEASHA